jgi:hypothetical protein
MPREDFKTPERDEGARLALRSVGRSTTEPDDDDALTVYGALWEDAVELLREYRFTVDLVDGRYFVYGPERQGTQLGVQVTKKGILMAARGMQDAETVPLSVEGGVALGAPLKAGGQVVRDPTRPGAPPVFLTPLETTVRVALRLMGLDSDTGHWIQVDAK